MLVFVIIACEVAFWVLLGAGMLVRYALGMRRLSAVLLISVPLIDVVLLAVSILDMRAGSEAGLRHGLAAAYIGYSVMFGHRTIQWCDERAAHRFAGGPPPWKPPKKGWSRVRHETVVWGKIVVAYGVAWAVTGILIVSVGDAARTMPLVDFMVGAAKVPLIAAIWPISHVFQAWNQPRTEESPEMAVEARQSLQPQRLHHFHGGVATCLFGGEHCQVGLQGLIGPRQH